MQLADSFPTTHPIGHSCNQVFRDMPSTDGRDAGPDFVYFGSGQLGVQREMPAVVRTGIAEIAAASPTSTQTHRKRTS